MPPGVTNATLAERVENVIQRLEGIDCIVKETNSNLINLNLTYAVEHSKVVTAATHADTEAARAHSRIDALVTALQTLDKSVDKMYTILKWVVGVATTIIGAVLIMGAIRLMELIFGG